MVMGMTLNSTISKKKKNMNSLSLKRDNSGSAIVIVIIAMAFIGVLVSVLMYTALLNYQMKKNNLNAKDSFYSAESVLDEIRLGIQNDVSEAIGKSYQSILTNFDAANAEDKQFRMRYGFLSEIQKKYETDSSAAAYDLTMLYNHLYSTVDGTVLESSYNGDVYTISGTVDADGNRTVVKTKNGVELSDASAVLPGAMKLYSDGLVLEGVKVTYTDAKGYVSIITTDLRINVPDMDFAEAVSLPSITSYSLIAQNNILVYPEIPAGAKATDTIAGSFYCRGLNIGSLPSETNLKPGSVTLLLKEDATDYDSDKRMVVDGSIIVGEKSNLTTDEYGELWAGSITMNGSGTNAKSDDYSTVKFGGDSVYVADDTNIYGNGNIFIAGGTEDGSYKGQYIGFGSGTQSATQETSADSSAIIVNGTNTEIDVSKLTNLTLAGNAYVGIGGKDSFNQSSTDIMMGQSIAVKSDQVAYLVPADCIGIDKKTGKQVSSSITNPMTLDTYQEYIQGKSDIYEVSDKVASDAIGGKTLSDFGIKTTETPNKVMYQRYIKQINSSLSLVYYYVLFDSSDSSSKQNANDYFEAYYTSNKSSLDAYSKLYTTGIVMRGDGSGFYTLHLAGNVVRYDAGAYSIKSATASDDKNNVAYTGLLSNSRQKYTALCKKLLDNYEQLGASEKTESANAYTNMVKETAILNFFADVDDDGSIISKTDAGFFTNGSGTALIVKGDYEYTGTGKDKFSGIIIATGDVKVDADFEGTIISGGSITMAGGIKVKPAKEAVIQAMGATSQINGKTYNVTDFLVGGSGYLGSTGKTYSDESVDLGDLVSYENWKKQ
jgi:hypothetical protein